MRRCAKMQFDSTTINMLIKGIGETFYMVLLSSALSYIIGIPLGIALVVTDKDGNTGRRVQFAQALQFGFTYTFASKK